MQARTTKDIRISNITKLFRAIIKNSPETRGALAKNIKLSLMTVTTLIDQLLELGMIAIEPIKNNNKNGRKADLLSPNTVNKWILIIDLTNYHFTYDVLDLKLQSRIDLADFNYNAGLSYADNLTAFFEWIKNRLKSDGYIDDLLGIGIVAPGPFLTDTGLIMNKRIPELSAINIKAVTQMHFPNTIVYVDEDVKFAAYSLLEQFADMEEKLAAYIYIDEGVGGGIINRMSIIPGKNSIAGDFGQMMANDTQNYEEVLSVNNLYRKLTDSDANKLNYGSVIKRIHHEKKHTKEIFDRELTEIYKHLTVLLYNIIWVINPDVIFIDCNYLYGLDSDYCQTIINALKEKFYESAFYVPELVFLESSMKGAYRGSGQKIIELYIKNAIVNGEI